MLEQDEAPLAFVQCWNKIKIPQHDSKLKRYSISLCSPIWSTLPMPCSRAPKPCLATWLKYFSYIYEKFQATRIIETLHGMTTICPISCWPFFLNLFKLFIIPFPTSLLLPISNQLFQSGYLFGRNIFAWIIHN